MYVVKNTYEKADGDVLLEHMLGPIENGNVIFADPRVLDIHYYRSPDRSYAESYIIWESQESYDSWNQDYEQQHLELQQQMDSYNQQMGISFQRIYPQQDGWDWAVDNNDNNDPRITPETRITFPQIFE